jgi:hypothetical protein
MTLSPLIESAERGDRAAALSRVTAQRMHLDGSLELALA